MADQSRPSWLNTLGWAAFLACSWTWCIGMFLPVLLIRDFGWWSFAVFAIPNCVGAAAFGWVVSKPQTSIAMGASHARAIATFSLVTISFQMFFLFSLCERPLGARALVPMAAWVVGGILGIAPRNQIHVPWGALVAFLGSLAALVFFVTSSGSGPTLTHRPVDVEGLAFLAPVCLFGFSLSPYLDGTFHRAARGVGSRVRSRFALGFLLLFPCMIGFTLLYGPSMLGADARAKIGTAIPYLAAWPVIVHIGLQLGFTMKVHAEVATGGIEPGVDRGLVHPKYFGALLGFAIVLGQVVASQPTMMEYGYRLFMSFYGLIFPAYVWICMIPTLRAPAKPTRRQLVVFGASIALAAPFYWLGFIEMRYWALGPGVLIPLVARLGIGKTGRSEMPSR